MIRRVTRYSKRFCLEGFEGRPGLVKAVEQTESTPKVSSMEGKLGAKPSGL